MDLEQTLGEMFREVHNNPINHNSVSKNFPRECFTEIFETIALIGGLDDKHINCEVKLHRGLCKVSFTYFSNVDKELPLERKVMEEFFSCEI